MKTPSLPLARIGSAFAVICLAGTPRLHAQPGSLDSNFNAIATTGQWGHSVTVQPDGKVVAAGTFGVMRFPGDGSVDPTFTLDPRVHPAGRVPALQPDGKIVTSGYLAGDGDAEYAGLLRLRADGSFDDSFDVRWFNNSVDFYSLAVATRRENLFWHFQWPCPGQPERFPG